jgi:dCTP deaminase
MVADCVKRTRAIRKACQERGSSWPPESSFGPLIDIDPFDPDDVGPNSFDVRLGPTLGVYRMTPRVKRDSAGRILWTESCLDMKEDNPIHEFQIPEEGFVIQPGIGYLGSTVEKTMCAGVVPWIDGRSSVGRLFVQVHMTAGRGDHWFGMDREGGCDWTLEITCVHPIRIYAGARIGQLTFLQMVGPWKKYKGKYTQQDGPTASQMWRDFPQKSVSFVDGDDDPAGGQS